MRFAALDLTSLLMVLTEVSESVSYPCDPWVTLNALPGAGTLDVRLCELHVLHPHRARAGIGARMGWVPEHGSGDVDGPPHHGLC